VDNKLLILIECKAIGLTLSDKHLKQAVDYAANKGVDWVVLTNGHIWRIYKVSFTKPINQELIAEFDFLTINPKKEEDIQNLYVLCKEGWQKSAIQDLYGQSQMLSRYTIGAAILSEPILEAIRRELRKAFPDAGLVDIEVISSVLTDEVIRREVLEDESATNASKKFARGVAKNQKQKIEKQEKDNESTPPPSA
jgi:predicted metal-dependent phosphoesterase TrpH